MNRNMRAICMYWEEFCQKEIFLNPVAWWRQHCSSRITCYHFYQLTGSSMDMWAPTWHSFLHFIMTFDQNIFKIIKSLSQWLRQKTRQLKLLGCTRYFSCPFEMEEPKDEHYKKELNGFTPALRNPLICLFLFLLYESYCSSSRLNLEKQKYCNIKIRMRGASW